MEFFRIHKTIPFMRHALVLNIISFVTFALAVFFLVTRGLHLSVEFTGGTVMEVSYQQTADLGKVREAIGKLGAPTLEEMLPLVYDDVPPRVHGIAARSLTAHLQKLVADGAVRERGGRYSLGA